jgi:hypothetical protein
MKSFSVFFENLGVKHTQPDSARSQRKKKKLDNIKEKVSKNMKDIRNILKTMGYNLKKADYSYTTRKDKLVAIEKIRSWRTIPEYKQKYVSALFILAHETGHTLQWGNDNKQKLFDFFFQKTYSANDDTEKSKLNHLEKMYYEIDAWVLGLQFIPDFMRPSYKRYAISNLKTYAASKPEEVVYSDYPYLKDVMDQLRITDNDLN